MIRLTFAGFLRTTVFLAVLAGPSSALRAGEAAAERTIVFVCLHGVVNSQMAAAYFNKVAKEKGLQFAAVSRGLDDRYRTVPVQIRDGLALDGLQPANEPRQLTVDDAGRASHVLAFDTVPPERAGQARVTYWAGVPIGIDNYETTRDAIVRRVDALVEAIEKETSK
ncbi:MAG: hypothetical protein R3D82_18700 [Xanthobacteraceae bacterium]|nr:hypothetical protein [Bradyrhizobium sp.]